MRAGPRCRRSAGGPRGAPCQVRQQGGAEGATDVLARLVAEVGGLWWRWRCGRRFTRRGRGDRLAGIVLIAGARPRVVGARRLHRVVRLRFGRVLWMAKIRRDWWRLDGVRRNAVDRHTRLRRRRTVCPVRRKQGQMHGRRASGPTMKRADLTGQNVQNVVDSIRRLWPDHHRRVGESEGPDQVEDRVDDRGCG